MTAKKALVVSLAVALVCSLLIVGCRGGAGQAPAGPPAAAPSGPAAPSQPAAEPKAEAPVVIEAYYPLNESHKFIADYLKAVEEANPGKVKLTLYDMQTEEGRKKWSTTGLSCAGVFVNGSTRHEITRDGKTETVDFLQRMDVFWSRGDFETVLAEVLKKAGQGFVAPKKTEAAPAAKTEPAAGAKTAPKAEPATASKG